MVNDDRSENLSKGVKILLYSPFIIENWFFSHLHTNRLTNRRKKRHI